VTSLLALASTAQPYTKGKRLRVHPKVIDHLTSSLTCSIIEMKGEGPANPLLQDRKFIVETLKSFSVMHGNCKC
jgi:hypothetical protein